MSRSITSSDANGATFETVGSSGGFSAGDLVYFSSTGYNKIPVSALPAAATTSPTKSYPYLTTSGDSGYFQATNFNGLGFSRSVALLSNGNAVAVYGDPQNGFPFFVVFNPSTRAIVVGPTVISSTFTMTGAASTAGTNIGVSAFAGGNFLVYWGNDAGGTVSRVNYATYTNAGVAVVAVTQDATSGSNNASSGHMRGVTLANGGFVLAFGSGNNVIFRAYDAAGVGQFAWVTLTNFATSSTSATSPSWGMAARSDNTYLLVGQSTVASTYNYAIYNYAGTAVVATTTFLNLQGSGGSGVIDCDVLSDGTTFVIAYAGTATGGATGWAFRFLPTGNTLGSAFSVIGNFNTNNGNSQNARLRVWSLGSTGFLITGSDSQQRSCYAVFNNSGTPLLGTTGTTGTASNIRNFGSTYTAGSQVSGVIVYGGVAEVYGAPLRSTNTPSTSFFRISLTDFNMVSATTASAALSIPASLIGSSGYAPSASTPSKAAFAAGNGIYPYAADLSASPSITTAGVYAATGGVISNVAAYDMCVLSNGNICVVTNSEGSGLTFVYIYNPITLAQISSTNITSTAGASGTFGATNIIISNVRVTPLSNGAFCVAIGTGANNLRLTAWTSAVVQQGSTVNISTFNLTFDAGGRFAALTTISGDRVVVAYFTSDTTLFYAVYSSALAVVRAATDTGITDSTAVRCATLVPVTKGFVVAAGRSTAGNIAVRTFYEFTTNTFTSPTYAQSDIGGATNLYTFGAAANSGASYIATIASTTTSAQLVGQAAPTQTVALTFGSPGPGLVCVGVTAAGAPFVMLQDGNVAGAAAASADTTAVTAITGWTSGPTSRVTSPQLRTIPLYGNLVLVGWLRDTASSLVFGTMLVNGNPDSIPLTSADVTTATPVYPQPTTTTAPAIPGFTFAGVAVTDCTAGGTGVIQTTGTTNLNSGYPTTTAQTFDYTGYAAPGVKGTIGGRSISMRKS
jgi:hypothetical protein